MLLNLLQLCAQGRALTDKFLGFAGQQLALLFFPLLRSPRGLAICFFPSLSFYVTILHGDAHLLGGTAVLHSSVRALLERRVPVRLVRRHSGIRKLLLVSLGAVPSVCVLLLRVRILIVVSLRARKWNIE